MAYQKDGAYFWGTAGGDVGYGTSGDDIFMDSAGNDAVHAGAGNDTILAGPGTDLLDGGTGNDLLIGGSGFDTFYFQRGDGADTIRNWHAGDLIQLHGVSPREVGIYQLANGAGFEVDYGGIGGHGFGHGSIILAGVTAFDYHGITFV